MAITGHHIVIFSSSPWDGMMFQRQRFAMEFAKNGNIVSFINNIPLQSITSERLRRLLMGHTTYLDTSVKIPKPEGVRVFSPFCLPPTLPGSGLFNQYSMRKLGRKIISRKNPELFISYIAAWPVLQLADILQPRLFIYISVHNYKGLGVPSTILSAEKAIVSRADKVFADSTYLINYLTGLKGGRVEPCLPGVDFKNFYSAYRGDEVTRKKTIGYFGFLGLYFDVDYFNLAVEAGFQVCIIGQIDRRIQGKLKKGIKFIQTVPNDQLPSLLRGIDILLIPHLDNEYTKGIVPAKLFECLATGKPVFWTNIHEAKNYANVTIKVKSPQEFILRLRDLDEDKFSEIRKNQLKLASEADWLQRFRNFESNLEKILN